MKLFIDIETIAAQSKSAKKMLRNGINEKISKLSAPSNYGEVKAAEWVVKKTVELQDGFEEAHLKTSFDGGLGEICCISVKINQTAIVSFSYANYDSENIILEEFVDFVESMVLLKGGTRDKITWIGHNLIEFDLPFLYKRLVINNVDPGFEIPTNARHGFAAFDTMKAWAGWKGRISQDNLCKTLGLPTKQGMDGSKVYQAWLDEQHFAIQKYCEEDVQTVFDIYNRLNFIKD